MEPEFNSIAEESWQRIIEKHNLRDVSVYATVNRRIVFYSPNTQILFWFAKTVKENCSAFVEMKDKNEFFIKDDIYPNILNFRTNFYPKPDDDNKPISVIKKPEVIADSMLLFKRC